MKEKKSKSLKSYTGFHAHLIKEHKEFQNIANHTIKNVSTLIDLYSNLYKEHKRIFDIFSFSFETELIQLHKLGLQQEFNSHFVEIGSHLGASACFLALAAQKRKSYVHCVDTWNNDNMSEKRKDTYSLFMNNTSDFRQIIRTHRGYSKEIANTFDKNISLLFIDGDHSYLGVKADILSWLPHMKSGAFIVFHDFLGGASKGVQEAIKELIYPIQKDEGQILESLYWTKI